jgi:autotransporter-associated beta strand protein
MDLTAPIPGLRICAFVLTLASGIAFAQTPPDLTAGGVPDNTRTINLGPTGMRGWVFHVNGGGRTADTGDARQIQVKAVDAGSPAAGFLAANDVILGANGTGAVPVDFTSDARKAFAQAIADAEARNPATLRIRRWRSGTTTNVTITLQNLGAYSATAPYHCPKSTEILKRGLAAIMSTNETAGLYSFGTLGLIAGNNPADSANAARMSRAQTQARDKVPTASVRTQMMSDNRDSTSMITWERGHTLIMLAEYYLLTGDSQVLPGIEAYAVNIAKNTSIFGTVGHIYAFKNPDGSANGPLGGVYGAVNSTGVPCFLGLLLARDCLPTNSPHRPVVEAAITRASRFFAYYAHKGSIPYGEHEPYPAHEGNGRNGLAAICFSLLNNRVPEAKFFAKSAAAAPSEREQGHTGAFFHYLWAPLGAAVGGEGAAALHFSRVSWMLDLNRRWNGLFVYDCLNGEGPNSGSTYNDFRMSTAALLTYALPLRQLRITGRSPNAAHQLTTADVTEAAAADTYSAAGRSNDALIADTGSWSPKTRRLAAIQLGEIKASVTTGQRDQLHATATNSALPAEVRAGACDALGRIGHASSAPILADLLTDPDKYVRYAAGEALRYLPSNDRDSQLIKILQATATNARPVFPLDEDDPLHFDHGRLGMLLFYNGSSYGPKGILVTKGKFDSVNRDLLHQAIRAVARTPIGMSRSAVATVYPWLSQDDLNAVAGPVVDAVRYGAPSDRMFSFGVRQEGLKLLEKFENAEGVPAGLTLLQDIPPSERTATLNVLEKYAASYRSVAPEPNVPGVVSIYLNNTDGNAEQNTSIKAAAQAVLDAINNDTNPRTLIPFKHITSLSADHPQIVLPTSATVLRLSALDHAEGDGKFTWRKLSGTGTVSFTPNSTSAAGQTTVTFPGTPGLYRLEVTMSDSRGLTEVSRTVDVELFSAQDALPENDTAPPSPDPMGFESPPSATGPHSITMTAITAFDLNGVEYFFESTAGGAPNSGWQDSPIYAPGGLASGTTYSFRVKARDKSAQLNETQFSASASASTPEAPANGTWTFDGGDNWSNSARWLNGIVANGADRTASFTANITGARTVTLDTPRTLGHIVFTDSTTSSHDLTISGNHPLTLDVTSGIPAINVTQAGRSLTIQSPLTGTKGITKTGPGRLVIDAAMNYSGVTTVAAGMLDLGSVLLPIGNGDPRSIAVSAGAVLRRNTLDNALLNRLIETNAEITVMSGTTSSALDFSGSSGADLPNAFLGNWASNGAKMEYSGTLTPAADNYRLGGTGSSGLLGIRSLLTGPQGLIVGGTGASGIRVNLVAANTFTGDTVIRSGAKLTLGNNLALQNSALDVGSAGGTFALAAGTLGGRITDETAAASPTFGGLKGSRNLLAVFTNSSGNNEANLVATAVTGFTLNVGPGKTCTYSGVIANFAPTTTLTKTGPGTQILNGANTYSGPTTISQGTLGLGAGGSILNSPSISIGPVAILDTTAKPTYAIPANQPLDIGISASGDGAAGKITAQTLNITHATVTFSIDGELDDPVYVLATYTTLQGSAFASAPSPPPGYVINYKYQDNKIALLQIVPSPEIVIEQPGSAPVANGGSIDIGTVTTGSETSLVFTIRNTGTTDLNLTGSPNIQITGTHASDFTVTDNPVTPVAAGGFTPFTLRFSPSAAGTRSASLSIVNDSEENPYVIHLGGTGQTPYAAWSGAPFDGDANGDGVANGIAWALGAANPQENATTLLPTLDNISDAEFLIFSYRRNHVAAADPNTTITVQYASELETWTDASPGPDIIITPFNAFHGPGIDKVEVKIRRTLAMGSKLFARLRVGMTN